MPFLFPAFILAALIPTLAVAKPYSSDPILMNEFREECRKQVEGQNRSLLKGPLPVGSIAYYPLGSLLPRQTRFSFTTYGKNLRKELRRSWGAALLHDEQRAAHGLDHPGFGIHYRGRIFIIEGHHQILAALVRGATTAPVQIVGDWSDFSPEEFEEKMRSEGLSYMQDAFGLRSPMRDWCELADDPNLELARLLLYKVKASFSDGRTLVHSHEAASLALNTRMRLKHPENPPAIFPAALKLNGGIPFLEFIIADALTRAGVVYRGTVPTLSEVKNYLKILKRANKKLPPHQRLILVEKVVPPGDLDLAQLIQEPLLHRTCALALAPSAVIVP